MQAFSYQLEAKAHALAAGAPHLRLLAKHTLPQHSMAELSQHVALGRVQEKLHLLLVTESISASSSSLVGSQSILSRPLCAVCLGRLPNISELSWLWLLCWLRCTARHEAPVSHLIIRKAQPTPGSCCGSSWHSNGLLVSCFTETYLISGLGLLCHLHLMHGSALFCVLQDA